VEHPARAFLRLRLGIGVGEFSDDVDDALPVALEPLDEWDVGRRLLEGRLAGADLDACRDAEVARGALPPGRLAAPVLARMRPVVEDIARHAEHLLEGRAQPASVDVKVALGAGRSLSGTVPGVCGDLLLTATYSRVNPRHRLAAWVRWLALCAAHPERPFEAATIGRARAGAPDTARVTIAQLRPPAPAADARRSLALRELGTLVDLYDRGMREPLPLACRTSAAFAHAAATGGNPAEAGRRAWESGWKRDKEDKDAEHQLVLGGVRPFADLLAQAPRADEAGEGWDATDPTRFGRYARRLWAGPLAREAVVDR
jgi:exodeoxyribonuclease V gamma subunit